MKVIEHTLLSDYDWEIEACCARCGSRHYLIFDEATEEVFCGPCLHFLRSHQKPQPATVTLSEEDDFCL